MNEITTLLLPAGAGALLGLGFYAGLWWTVNKAVLSKKIALWFIASWLLRNGITLAGFYLVAQGQWERLVACLFGFLISRFFVTRYLKVDAVKSIGQIKSGVK